MGLYADLILPRLVHGTMQQEVLTAYRRRLIPSAEGRVLEVGVGSGLNLPLYSSRTRVVIGLDPSPRLLRIAFEPRRRAAVPSGLMQASAERIPLEDASIDTVVSTWTLCSIPDVGCALGELRRVLKPSGRLLFVEHGRSPDASVSRWQDRLTPLWRRVAGGCHLNRAIARIVEGAGFRVERLETGYMRGPRPMTFMYEGSARPS